MKLILRPKEATEQDLVDRLFQLVLKEVDKGKTVIWVRNEALQILPNLNPRRKMGMGVLDRLKMYYCRGKVMKKMLHIVSTLTYDPSKAGEDFGLFILELDNPRPKLFFKLRPLLERTESVLRESWPKMDMLILMGMEYLTDEKMGLLKDKLPYEFLDLMDLDGKDEMSEEATEVDEENINLTQIPLVSDDPYFKDYRLLDPDEQLFDDCAFPGALK
ncbi:hypothetical protein FO519_005970 [Halicephalobus sp. NKZ332]|nr:hypothetical protein FO519_005970 [Halicephalobus sp. NKZ332]